jgi:valyl-tRNA synthetase
MEKPSKAASAIVDEIQIFVHDVIDPEAERKRLEKQKEQILKGLRGTEGKLNNENFISRAKPEVVEQARTKLKEFQDQLAAIEKHIAEIED